jgi:hypothetical protein
VLISCVNLVLVVKMQCFGLFIIMLYMKVSQAVTWEWDDKIAVLYPSLPIAAPWSENENCRNHSRMLLQALNNFTLWAMQSRYHYFITNTLSPFLFLY